ncbi:hypothetical protein MAR_007637, partial [Mya arenaria]
MMWEPGLAKFTQDHRFVMSLHMMADVLPHLAEVSAALQINSPFLKNIVVNLEDRFPDLPLLQKLEDLAEHFHLPVDKTLSEWRQ